MATQNTITDLTNHLFEALERLNDDELQGKELETEIERSKAMVGVSKQIVGVFKTELDALKLASNCGYDNPSEILPRQLICKNS